MNLALLLAALTRETLPKPLTELPADAHAVCREKGSCHLFEADGPGYCAGGCRMSKPVKQVVVIGSEDEASMVEGALRALNQPSAVVVYPRAEDALRELTARMSTERLHDVIPDITLDVDEFKRLPAKPEPAEGFLYRILNEEPPARRLGRGQRAADKTARRRAKRAQQAKENP